MVAVISMKLSNFEIQSLLKQSQYSNPSHYNLFSPVPYLPMHTSHPSVDAGQNTNNRRKYNMPSLAALWAFQDNRRRFYRPNSLL